MDEFSGKNIDELTGFKYVNITSIVEDPNDPNHHLPLPLDMAYMNFTIENLLSYII